MVASVDGSVRTADAHWEGCRSAFNETYASYRYAAQVRLDALADDLLLSLDAVVSDLGLAPTADAQPNKLRATRDGLEVCSGNFRPAPRAHCCSPCRARASTYPRTSGTPGGTGGRTGRTRWP